MRTLEFVTYLGTLKGMTAGAARARGAELMQHLGLGEWQTATVDALSKGMQQKLQFIATIVHDPELLILDEPFSGLDPVNVEVMTETILALRRARSHGHLLHPHDGPRRAAVRRDLHDPPRAQGARRAAQRDQGPTRRTAPSG